MYDALKKKLERLCVIRFLYSYEGEGEEEYPVFRPPCGMGRCLKTVSKTRYFPTTITSPSSGQNASLTQSFSRLMT